jgi:hypothetical protein
MSTMRRWRISTKTRGDYFLCYNHMLNPGRSKYWMSEIRQPLKSLMYP